MWNVAAILLASGIIAWIEAPGLVRAKRTREISLFAVLLIFGTGVSIAKAMRAPLPNPLDWIAAVFGPVAKAIFAMVA